MATQQKRDKKQAKINEAQARLDKANAHSARDLNRNKWNKIKSDAMKIFIGILVLIVVILFFKG